MKWNQKSVLAAVPKIAKQAGVREFEGETPSEFVAWMKKVDEAGVIVDGLEAEADQRKAFKTVFLTPDEEVVPVDDETAEAMKASMNPEDPEDDAETKAEGDPDEDEEVNKAYRDLRKAVQKSGKNAGAPFMKSVHDASRGPAIHDGSERRAKKMYNDAVRNGTEFRGKRPMFPDADVAEQFGAAMRVMATKGGIYRRYDQIDNDCAIIGTKAAGSTTDNAFAASLIVHETAREIIDNLVEHGAMRQAVSITSMPDGFYKVPRKTANMQMAYRNENGAFASTNPQYDMVEITAHEAGGICTVSNSLLNDSAFSIADEVGKSTIEGRNEFEDEEFFNGTYGTHGGLLGTAGADSDSTYDAALAADWDDWTINKLQAARAKVPAKAWKRGNVKMACSTSFLQSVIYRFALSAGGNSGDRLLIGMTNGQLHWDGVPIVLTEVLPSTYTADQIVAYIGDFDAGSKVGIVAGSDKLDASSQRYWDLDQFAWKYTERIGFTYHDVTGTNSMVIAIKD